MVKTLAETVKSLTLVVNTGSYEYNLDSIRSALSKIEEFTDKWDLHDEEDV